MDAVATVRISGPLTCHVEGFAADLRSQGYTELSVRNQLKLMADLSRWLHSQRIPLERIDPPVVHRFLRKRRRTYTRFTNERALAPLIGYLREIAVVAKAVASKPRRGVLGEYERYVVDDAA